LALRGRYRLGTLSLMFWDATLMIFIDHPIGCWREGRPFPEAETEGWVSSGILLGRNSRFQPRGVLADLVSLFLHSARSTAYILACSLPLSR